MAAEYLNATNDLAFLQEHISSLDAEFDFWRTNRLGFGLQNSHNLTAQHLAVCCIS